MISLFSHAVSSEQMQGSTGDFDLARISFARQQRSGLVVADWGPELRQVYLYLDGQPFAAYELSNSARLALERDGEDWPTGAALERLQTQNITFHTLSLPDQAVRAAWQALDWYPPQRSETLDLANLGVYLEKLRAEGRRGLLQIAAPDLDGFALVWDGQPISSEIGLASAQGFIETLPEGRGATQLTWSDASSASRVSELTGLRVAFRAWVNAWLSGYQQLVGNNLLLGLDQTANTWLRQRHQNLRLAGLIMVDHHLFLNMEDAAQSYQNFSIFLGRQMGRVIGDQLMARAAAEALRRLKSPQQATLQVNGLGANLLLRGA